MTTNELEMIKKALYLRLNYTAHKSFADIDIKISDEVPTAAVAAKPSETGEIKPFALYVNSRFMDNLTFGQKVFVLGHECLHIAHEHFKREVDKPLHDVQLDYERYCEKEQDEKKREIKKKFLMKHYRTLWNIATDACINATLINSGFTFPDGVKDPDTGEEMHFVKMKEGYSLDAETIYDMLVEKEREKEKEKEKKQDQNSGNGNKQSSNSQSGGNGGQSGEGGSEENQNDSKSNNNDYPFDDDFDPEKVDSLDSHDEWCDDRDSKKDYSKKQQEVEDEIKSQKKQKEEASREERDSKKNLDKLLKDAQARSSLDSFTPKTIAVSWKRFLVGYLEKDIEEWGRRRANKYNHNSRIEEKTVETLPKIQIVLDTSGSISESLLKGFLSQIIPLFDNIYDTADLSIEVGCFGDAFLGFEKVNSVKALREYKPKAGGGTNFEAAATAFSKERNITKVVFTDGGVGKKQETRGDDIIWVVFGGNDNFKPLGGKVIRVSDTECKRMNEDGLRFIEAPRDVNFDDAPLEKTKVR